MARSSIKWIDIVGARPQFVKLSPILKSIQKHNQSPFQIKIEEILIHTGQHYDENMSRVFFEEFNLKAPDYHLGIGSLSQPEQTAEILKHCSFVLAKEKPDVVVVYGDTNSTLGGALAAAKLNLPIAHVEAGIRSFNKKMQEEINRILADHISSFLFCPTQTAVENLKHEGVTKGVCFAGDVMYDAILQNIPFAEKHEGILKQIGIAPQKYFIATVHRAENTDAPEKLSAILNGLQDVAKKIAPVVIPLHPRTRNRLETLRVSISGLIVIEPLSYLEMLVLLKNAKGILTDSGGLQKEAYFLQIPCVTLREDTEWVETLDTGWNVLAGFDSKKIVESLMQVLESPKKNLPLFGDGNASDKIVDILVSTFLNSEEHL
jgi:UDP-GlcNAc3NAcA epimerase